MDSSLASHLVAPGLNLGFGMCFFDIPEVYQFYIAILKKWSGQKYYWLLIVLASGKLILKENITKNLCNLSIYPTQQQEMALQKNFCQPSDPSCGELNNKTLRIRNLCSYQ